MSLDHTVLLAELLAERFPPEHVVERELTNPVPAPREEYPRARGAAMRSQARLDRLQEQLRQEQGERWTPLPSQLTA